MPASFANKVAISSTPPRESPTIGDRSSPMSHGVPGRAPLRNAPIRLLRLAQVLDITGLGKTMIYELQAQDDFPMSVKITSHSVGWVEEEVQAWLARRIAARTPPAAT